MSRLFRKEVNAPASTAVTETPSPMSFLGKGTRAANEVDPEKAAKLRTLDEVARRAAQRDALREVSRRPRR